MDPLYCLNVTVMYYLLCRLFMSYDSTERTNNETRRRKDAEKIEMVFGTLHSKPYFLL